MKYYHGRIFASHIMNGENLIAMMESQNHTFFNMDYSAINIKMLRERRYTPFVSRICISDLNMCKMYTETTST